MNVEFLHFESSPLGSGGFTHCFGTKNPVDEVGQTRVALHSLVQDSTLLTVYCWGRFFRV